MTAVDTFGGWLRLQRRAARPDTLELARRAHCSASTIRRMGEVAVAARLVGAATKLEDELGMGRVPTAACELDESVSVLHDLRRGYICSIVEHGAGAFVRRGSGAGTRVKVNRYVARAILRACFVAK